MGDNTNKGHTWLCVALVIWQHATRYCMATTLSYDDGILYVRSKAAQGILEKVFIKRASIPATASAVGAVIMLVDTLNGTWMPQELVSEADAIELARTYLQDRLAAME